MGEAVCGVRTGDIPIYNSGLVHDEVSGEGTPSPPTARASPGCEAQNLLISTDFPMAKIAEQVGFETQNYFNLQFSKHVGMPPKKYRESFVGKKKP